MLVGPVSQMRTLRPRMVKCFAVCHRAGKRRNLDLAAACLLPTLKLKSPARAEQITWCAGIMKIRIPSFLSPSLHRQKSEGSEQASSMIFLTLKGHACLSLQFTFICVAVQLISALPTSTSNDVPQIGSLTMFFLAHCWAHGRHSEMICYGRKERRDRKFHVDTRAALSLPVSCFHTCKPGWTPWSPRLCLCLMFSI